jgi:DNA-binding transcriptional ArsR family regulator
MIIDMKEFDKLQSFFQALADRNRLHIIKVIGGEQRSVSEIVEITGLSQPLVSHHLRLMREQGFLETQRDGPFIYHRLKDTRLLDALAICAECAADFRNDQAILRTFCCPPWRRPDR